MLQYKDVCFLNYAGTFGPYMHNTSKKKNSQPHLICPLMMFKSAYWMHASTAFCGGNDGDRHFIIILFPTHLPWLKKLFILS